MAQVVKRPLAFSDLSELWSFIAEDSEVNADRFLSKLEEKFALLATQPRMGRLRNELMENLRSFPIERYIVFLFPRRMVSNWYAYCPQSVTSTLLILQQ